MDASQSRSTGVDVTVMDDSPGQVAARELARGMLLSQLTVMVPDPPHELLRAGGGLIAVIAQRQASGVPAEAIPVASATRVLMGGAGLNAACAMLRLDRPTRHAPADPRHSAAEITEAVRGHQGNLWEAMAALGYTSLTGYPAAAGPGETDDGESSRDIGAGPLKDLDTWCVKHPGDCKH
jgi:hypothetical protein